MLTATHPLHEQLEQIITAQTARPLNGIVLVAQGHEVVYEKVSGTYGQPLTHSQFVIGSISKQMTATLVLELVDQGLIHLDDSINLYLPELDQDWASQVHVKHLLNHTSGIISLDKPLAFQPGTQFQYSPILGFYLASQIAERVSGKTFQQLTHELFARADMSYSGLLVSEQMDKNQVVYPLLPSGFKESNGTLELIHSLGENDEMYNESWNPAGGIISTAHDLLAWNLALHDGNLLSPQSYHYMITPQIQRKHPRYGIVGYGCGIQVLEQDGFLEISHSGYIDGYCATLTYYPCQRISVIILENISWDTHDIIRAFSVHDYIRNAVRSSCADYCLKNHSL